MEHPPYTIAQLLTTKLRIPALANAIVERPQLHALLEYGQRHRLTLLSTPPGYGKTTLVADWLRRTAARSDGAPRAAAWLTLTAEDDRPAVFWSYIAAALDTALPHAATTFSALLRAAHQGAEAALVSLLNALSALPAPLLLVIDNYQYIATPEIHQSLAFLIEHLPEQVHIVLLTNHDPSLPLPRWRARGMLFELRTEQLRCTLEEASAFFAASGTQGSADDLCQIVQQAEGWFAGLRLLSIAFGQGSGGRLGMADVEQLYRGVLDYFFCEAVVHQPAAVRMFLLRTAVLDEMSAAVCDAILDGIEEEPPASELMLRHLASLNLFIEALDRRHEWYRYHTLFRQALRHLLAQHDPEIGDALCQRASVWYEAQGQCEAAITYALRGRAWERAASLIERWLGDATARRHGERLRCVAEWIAQLPVEVVRTRHALQTIPAARWPAALPEPEAALIAREVGGAAALPAQSASAAVIAQNDLTVQALSVREQEVLELIAGGASNYEIADALVLSLHTVKRHTSNILAKLNAANRTQAVAYARVYGITAAHCAVGTTTARQTAKSRRP